MKTPIKIKATFCKTTLMRFISHLDVARLLQRALRRGNFNVVTTNGFSPRIKLSFPKALKLGVESENETVFFYLEDQVELNSFKNRLNAELPDGIKITAAEAV